MATHAMMAVDADLFACAAISQTYWGQMPLSSENPQAWEMFTRDYVEKIDSVSSSLAAAGAM